MKTLNQCRLYTFVDTAYLQGRDPEVVFRALSDGGSDVIQLRAKNWPRAEVQKLADKLARAAQSAGVLLVINDYPDIAAEVGAPACHLGQEDFDGYSHVREVREGVAKEQAASLQIGLSTHGPDQARRALAAGADYIAVGPVYRTDTKPTAEPVTLEYVRWAADQVKIPWFAIGGISLGTVDAVLEAGATRICVVSAILLAPNIARACQSFKDRLLSAARNPIQVT